MGGSGSRERKLTIENDSPMSVIKVSEDVVHRMKGKEGTGEPVRRIGQGDGQTDPQVYQHYNQAPLTSIQLRQATIDALKDNDDYWDKRIKSLQQRHQQMQEIMEEEFCKAMEEMKGSSSDPKQKKGDTCVDNRKQIIACYKKCKDQPLKCAKEVQEFAECIDQRRASLIAKAKC